LSLSGLRNQTITVTKTGPTVDFHGVRAAGADITERVRIQLIDETIVDVNGREMFVKALIFFRKDANVETEDLISVLGQKMELLILEQVPGGDGRIHHLEGKVGRRSRPN